MKRNSIIMSLFVTLLFVLAQITSSAQITIASWTFPTQFAAPNTPTSFISDDLTGTLYLNGTNGSSLWDQATELNMNTGVPGYDLALVNQTSNGKSVIFAFSMTGLQNLTMNFNIRKTSSGHTTHEWSYSTDGLLFTIIPGVLSIPSADKVYEPKSLDFSAITALTDQATVFIKLTLDGATSTSGNNRFDNIVFQGTSSSTNQVATPIFSPSTSVIYTPTNVAITCTTAGASIHYTTDGTTPTATSTLYTTPIPVTAAMTINAIAFSTGLTESFVATASYTFPVEVPTIAAFKAVNTTTNTTVYKITGDVTFVYRNGRNVFIKDATGGMLIYDNLPSTITNTYDNGYIISGGIFGSYTLFNGLTELIPTHGTAIGTPGTPVVPITITADNLIANYAQYESQLIKLENVTFAAGTFGTGAAGNVNITQGTTTLICRNQFGAITDYTTDVTQPYNVVGFAIPFNTDKQIAPRDLNDILPANAIPTYTVTFPVVTGATFTPETGSVSPVDSLGNFSFTVALAAAYNNSIITVKANGTTLTPVAGVYTIANIIADQVITIEGVAMNTYTITATAGANGSITPSGVLTYNHGTTQIFTFTANATYQISTITVDGTLITNVPSYTFTNITANHTIAVTFELIPVNQHTITASAGANGTITPNGIVNVIAGNDKTFTIAPSTGYHIDSVLVDGLFNATATNSGTYTFTNVTANHTISASFAINTYTITATAGTNGMITPSGTVTVNYATNASFTASPNGGHEIDSLFIDGVSVPVAPTYLFTNVTANHTIHYTFSLIPLPNFIEDFETLVSGTGGYAGSTVTFATGAYYVKGYIAMDANDRFLGTRSVRMRGNASDPTGNEITMSFDKPNGIGTVSFKYASYSTHTGGTFVVQYSADQGVVWNDAPNGSFTAPAWDAVTGMLTGTVVCNIPGNARIRFFKAMQGSGTSVNIDNIEITDFNAANTVSTPTFSHPSGTIFAPINVAINTLTPDATIRYTTDGTAPTETSTIYTTAIPVTATTTIKAQAFKTGMTSSVVVTAIYTFPVHVATIEAFIDAANGITATTPYKITGDVTFVFRSGRFVYIKDNTASLLVVDNETTPFITHTYQNGDVISGGIMGTYTSYNGLTQFMAINDWAASTLNTGAITPTVVTAQEIAENYGLYESKLVTIEGVTFSAGAFNTETTTNVNFTQGTNQMAARNVHKTLSMTIPEGLNADITGFPLRYNTTFQLAPRDNADIVANTLEQVATPTFTPATGSYTDPLTVIITCATPNAQIFFTVDGTTPSNLSHIYDAPFILEVGEHVVKAMAYKEGMTPSEIAVINYSVTVGIDEYQAQMVQIYPNPASQSIIIKNSSDALEIDSYQIYDQYGKLISTNSFNIDNTLINVSDLTTGIYFVRLQTNMGVINKKFVKVQ